ncbi:MAG: hypothetical protein ABS960_06035 [Solibacillus isronensis]
MLGCWVINHQYQAT